MSPKARVYLSGSDKIQVSAFNSLSWQQLRLGEDGANQDLKHLRGARKKVIFLDHSLSSCPYAGAAARSCLSLAFEAEKSQDDAASTDPVVLADGGAVTSSLIRLDQRVLDKLVSRINASRESVSPGQRRSCKRLGRHTGHQERLVPRNSIEEFDPGSA